MRYLNLKFTQNRSDSEISYRQELELKYKELLDEAKFEKKLFDQESQKLKDQLESTNQTIKHLEIKFSESIRKEIEKNEILMKRLTELQLENESIKYEKKQSEEQLDSMRSMICNFENVVSIHLTIYFGSGKVDQIPFIRIKIYFLNINAN